MKKVGSKRYLHRTALAELSAKDRERVQAVSAEVPGFKWSVVRLDGSQIMLGRTTSFETDPHPALLESITFESGLQTNRKRYGTNPPIYHRIELMLPQGHPARRKAASRTKRQQAKGLLSRPDIGTRRSWRRAKGSSNSLNQRRVREDVEMRNCRTIVDQFLYRAKLGYTRKRRGSRGQYTEQFADLIRSGDGGMDYAEELARAAGVPLDLSGADLSGISLTHVKLIAINLSGADLSGSTLYSSTLIASDLTGANLTDTNLRMAKLSRADLSGANLSDAHLSGAWLLRSNLSGADLSGADLIGAKMKGINLTGANLTGANLNGADLSGADLTGAVLTDAWLIRIRYNLETKWPKGFTPPPSTWS